MSYFNGYDKTEQGGSDQVEMYTTTLSRVRMTDLNGYDETERGRGNWPWWIWWDQAGWPSSNVYNHTKQHEVTELNGYNHTKQGEGDWPWWIWWDQAGWKLLTTAYQTEHHAYMCWPTKLCCGFELCPNKCYHMNTISTWNDKGYMSILLLHALILNIFQYVQQPYLGLKQFHLSPWGPNEGLCGHFHCHLSKQMLDWLMPNTGYFLHHVINHGSICKHCQYCQNDLFILCSCTHQNPEFHLFWHPV